MFSFIIDRYIAISFLFDYNLPAGGLPRLRLESYRRSAVSFCGGTSNGSWEPDRPDRGG